MKNFNCEHFGICGGCQYLDPYSNELDFKRLHIETLMKNANIDHLLGDLKSTNFKIHSYDGFGHRNKVDLSYQNGIYGFFDHSHQLFALQDCQHWSPKLTELFARLKLLKLPFSKASLRLRTGELNETNGLWIDAAHVELKEFLEDKNLLKNLFKIFKNIEIGQKAKRLDENSLKLLKTSAEQLETYFYTYDYSLNKQLSLKSFIKSFTQPSVIYNKIIIKAIMDLLKMTLSPSDKVRLLELGAGIGNYTLSFLSHPQIQSVKALEYDQLSIMALEKNAIIHEMHDKLIFSEFDYHSHSFNDFFDYSFLFLNPSRSGVGKFMNYVTQISSKNILYLSCYPESMLKDLASLPVDYQIKAIEIIDQFPRSKHYECLLLISRKD